MKRLQGAVLLGSLGLTGCHVIFGLEEFTEATADDSADAGSPAPGPSAEDDDAPQGGTGQTDDDVGGGGDGQAGADGTGGTGATGGNGTSGGSPSGGSGNGNTSGNGGTSGDAGSLSGGGGGATSLGPDGGMAGATTEGCDACPSEAPVCLEGACVACEPGTRECNEQGSPRECDSTGTWAESSPCQEGLCLDGLCQPPSCAGLAADCGGTRDQDCCSSLPVPGGTFQRQQDPALTVTLSDFRLDEFEITVGRFRKFLEARDTWSPEPGDGAYPRSPDSGWDVSWPLGSASQIVEGLASCDLSPYSEMPGDNESVPISCINWYEAFAFCAWDGGHLPTDAQWSYAAMGGAEQRHYPWSVPPTSTSLESNHANYNCNLEYFTPECLRVVGSFPEGAGLFGQKDLMGNVIEWMLDEYDSGDYFECGPSQVNCLSKSGSERGLRGGSYKGRGENLAIIGDIPDARLTFFVADGPGARCARAALDAPMESCTPADADCSDATRRVCDASGQWVPVEECAEGCQAGSCNECSGTNVGCVDNAPATCGTDGTWVPEAPCSGSEPVCRAGECVAVCSGLDTCGPANDQDCCEALPVSGGTFARLNDDTLEATVSPFSLDRFEVTVGRFREFVDAYPGSRPAQGAGAHPLSAASGWDDEWDTSLAATRDELVDEITSCYRNLDLELSSYTREPGEHENRAMNCVSFFEAFAYCAWAGGRLPTFAEHNFAYVGGAEQRFYPWSVPPGADLINPSYANYDELTCPYESTDYSTCVALVGSSPAGASAFGQEDLAGNLAELTVDLSTWPLPTPCNDCIQSGTGSTSRRTTGGSWLNTDYELQGDFNYGSSPETNRAIALGFRCVQP